MVSKWLGDNAGNIPKNFFGFWQPSFNSKAIRLEVDNGFRTKKEVMGKVPGWNIGLGKFQVGMHGMITQVTKNPVVSAFQYFKQGINGTVCRGY